MYKPFHHSISFHPFILGNYRPIQKKLQIEHKNRKTIEKYTRKHKTHIKAEKALKTEKAYVSVYFF